MKKRRLLILNKVLKCIIVLCMLILYIPQSNIMDDVFAAGTRLGSGDGGRTLGSGTYEATNINLNGGLQLSAGASVTLYIYGTVNAYGYGANGGSGATAGIGVPDGSTLIIRGSGTLNAYGGNAANGTDGQRAQGYDANWSCSKCTIPDDRTGAAGAGGSGGGGAAAGIGGSGGGASREGQSSGDIYFLGDVNVRAAGGKGATRNGDGGAGGFYAVSNGSSAVYNDWAYAGGGGGGGGGAGFPAADLGGGGAGGGNGSPGENGAYSGKYADGGNVHAKGGKAGGGGQGYPGWAFNGGVGNGYSSDDGDGADKYESAKAGGGSSTVYKSTHNVYTNSAGQSGMNDLIGRGGLGAGNQNNGTTRWAYDARDLDYTFNPTGYTYDGSAKNPTITINWNKGGVTNIESHFTKTIDQNTNVNAGEGKVKIEGTESFGTANFTTGTMDAAFPIAKASYVPNIKITPVSNSITYGSTYIAEITNSPGILKDRGVATWSVVSGNATIAANSSENYSVTVTPNSAAPVIVKVSIVATSNYNATSATASTVNVLQKNVSSLSVDTLASQIFTGRQITPAPVVKDGAKVLENNKDYTLVYTNNINKGLATITINGKGNYTGSKTVQFNITAAQLSTTTLTPIRDVVYTGDPQSPTPTLVYNGIPLVFNTDFYLSANKNNTNVGTAELTFTGKGNFAGDIKPTFKITQETLKSANIVITQKPKDVVFNGQSQQSSVPTLTYKGKVLTSNSDYTLTYDTNTTTKVGVANITITGKGNFKDTLSTSYKITPATLTLRVDANQSKYYGTSDPSAFTYKYSGNFAGFTPEFSGALSRNPGETLGSYEILQNTLKLNDTSLISKNYVLKYEKDTFQIKEFSGEGANATLDGTMGENDWYTSLVKIKAPNGYKISFSNALTDNAWSDEVSKPDGDYSETGAIYFLKDNSNNAVTVAKTIKYKQDQKVPRASIVIDVDSYTDFLNKITFNLFFNKKIEARLFGSDDLSGIQSISFVESEKELTLEEIKKIPDTLEEGSKEKLVWKEGKKALVSGERAIIYLKVIDMAGNISYVSTDGIVYDDEKPLLSADYEYNDVWTKKNDVVITGETSDVLAGLKDRYVTYTIDGKQPQVINVDENGKFVIENLPDGNYNVVIKSFDKAGNDAIPVIIKVKKDCETPQLTLSADMITIKDSQKITFNPITGVSGPEKIEILVDGVWTEVNDAFSKGYKASENNVTYTFRLKDIAGGYSKESEITFSNIDTIQPKVEVSAYTEDENHKDVDYESESWTNRDIFVNFKNVVSNLGTSTYEWKLDDGEYVSIIPTDSIAQIPAMTLEGKHVIKMKITSEGGLSSEEVSITMNKDNTAPIAQVKVKDSITSDLLNLITFDLFYKESVKVEVSGEDVVAKGVESGIKSVEYYILQSEENSVITDYPTTIKDLEKLTKDKWVSGNSCFIDPNKTYVAYTRVIDNAGNVTYAGSNGLMVDDKSPEIDINYDYDGIWTHDALIEGTVSDNLSGAYEITYKIGDDEYQPLPLNNQNFSLSGIPDGQKEVSFKVKDHAQNELMSDIIHVWQDSTVPTISVSGEDDVQPFIMVDVNAKHKGLSKLDKVEVKLDDGKWIDISDTYMDGYKATQNGTYTFKATSGANISSEASIQFGKIFVDKLEPKITVLDSEGKELSNGDWTSSNISVKLHNEPSNVNGIKYYYRTSADGEWIVGNPQNGIVQFSHDSQGSYHYEFKESLMDDTGESDVISFDVNIDRNLPTAKIKIQDQTWSDWKAFLNVITFGQFYKDEQVFEIEAEDNDSGIDSSSISYFVMESEPNKKIDHEAILATGIEKFVDGRWVNKATGALSAGYSYVVYAKIQDVAGNVKYISSDGLIVDDISPELSTTYKEGKWIINDSENVHINAKDSLVGLDLESAALTYRVNESALNTIHDVVDDGFDILNQEFGEGKNIVYVNATDRVGNKSNELIFFVNKDTVEPNLNVTSDESDLSSKSKLNFEITTGASGVSKMEILYPEQSEWIDISDAYQDGYEVKLNGLYAVRMSDGAGRQVNKNITISKVDSKTPIVSISAIDSEGTPYLSQNWTNKSVTVSFSDIANCDGPLTYEYSINGNGFQNILANSEGIASISVNQLGRNDLIFRITSRTGVVSQEMPFVVANDTSTPTIELLSLPGWHSKQILNVVANDEGSGVALKNAYSFNDGETWQSMPQKEFTANENVKVQVKDELGNTTKGEVKIIVDNMEPMVENAKQNKDDWAQSKVVLAGAEDSISEDESSGSSGIQRIFLTSKNPFKQGKVSKKTPTLSDYSMKEVANNSWITNEEITDNIGATIDENYWVVAVDFAENATAYSLVVDKILANEDENPVKPDKPGEGDKPSGGDKPGEGDKPGGGDKPGEGDKPSGGDKPSEGDKPSGGDKPGEGDKPSGGDKPGEGNNPSKPNEIPDIDNIVDKIINNPNSQDQVKEGIDLLETVLKTTTLTENERQIIESTLENLRNKDSKASEKSSDSLLNALSDKKINLNNKNDMKAFLDKLAKDDQGSTVFFSSKEFIYSFILLIIAGGIGVVVVARSKKKYKKLKEKVGERDEVN